MNTPIYPSPFTACNFDANSCIYDGLITSIVDHRCVLFLGAGLSVGSGIPDWSGLLTELTSNSYIKSELIKKEAIKTVEDSIKLGRFARAFDIVGSMMSETENGLTEIHKVLKKAVLDKVPNRAHAILNTIPFDFVLTTNFDTLLKTSNHQKYEQLSALKAPGMVIERLHKRRPNEAIPLLHLRGILTESEPDNDFGLIFSERAFARLARESVYNSYMNAILASRTALFVGCSLEDEDLKRLLADQNQLTARSNRKCFHYAILPKDESDPAIKLLLEKNYGVRVISYLEPDRAKWTDAVALVLQRISGAVARNVSDQRSLLFFGQSDFSRRAACSKLVEDICKLTGSNRGDIFFIRQADSKTLSRESAYGTTSAKFLEPKPNSVCSTLLQQRKVSNDFIYLPKVGKGYENDWKKSLEDQGLRSQGAGEFSLNAEYQDLDPKVRSQLTCPIMADGECVGILNLESYSIDAYSPDHLIAASSAANEAGSAYVAADRRERASRGLLACVDDNCSNLRKILNNDKLVAELVGDCFIIWRRNFTNGFLIENTPHPTGTMFPELLNYTLDRTSGARSLPEYCCLQRRRLFVKSAEDECKRSVNDKGKHDPDNLSGMSRLNPRGCIKYKIEGAVAGIPIRSRGHLAGVLVAWAKGGKEARTAAFGVAVERIHRISDVLANIPGNSEQNASLEKAVIEFLAKLSAGAAKALKDPKEQLKRILKIVADAQCNSKFDRSPMFPRIRLFVKSPDNEKDRAFKCIWASVHPQYAPAKEPSIKFEGVMNSSSDAYFQYTNRRVGHDPYARVQEILLNDQGDPIQDLNRGTFGKDPNGIWIVAPIVATQYSEDVQPSISAEQADNYLEMVKSDVKESYEMFGFISIDNHKPVKIDDAGHWVGVEQLAKDETSRADLLRFQRRVADVITDLLAPIITDADVRNVIWNTH